MNGIQVKNLVKTYITQSTDIILNGAKRPSTTRTVLHGVSVDFPAGKLTAILGRSGCGKSTLLKIICGLVSYRDGSVSRNGHPVTGPDAECGMVFQDHRLLP